MHAAYGTSEWHELRFMYVLSQLMWAFPSIQLLLWLSSYPSHLTPASGSGWGSVASGGASDRTLFSEALLQQQRRNSGWSSAGGASGPQGRKPRGSWGVGKLNSGSCLDSHNGSEAAFSHTQLSGVSECEEGAGSASLRLSRSGAAGRVCASPLLTQLRRHVVLSGLCQSLQHVGCVVGWFPMHRALASSSRRSIDLAFELMSAFARVQVGGDRVCVCVGGCACTCEAHACTCVLYLGV